ncbi:MAG: S1C family serine protease [Verrucomicrobiota bacterium]
MNSELTHSERVSSGWKWFPARSIQRECWQRVHWSQLVFATLLSGAICGLWQNQVLAQDTESGPPDTVVAPVQNARAFGSQADESIRFGVSARDLYERIEPALVEVFWGGANSRIYSMGFKATNEGIYATVIPDGVTKEDGLLLRGNGREQAGTVLAIDVRTRLCLVKTAEGSLSSPAALSLRPTGDQVDSGSLVFSINRPGTGEADVCVAGRLAGRDSIYQGLELPTSFYRVNMHLLRGAAGSPLLDEAGGVLGILTGRALKEASEHHALPSAVLEKLLRDQRRIGRSSRAWIGASFHLQSTTPQVMTVRENSPAEQCGLRSGDVILRVGNRRVADLNDLVDVFYVASVGRSLNLEVLRGIEKLSMKLTPAAVPQKADKGRKKR